MRGACLAINGVAGSGKSLVAAACAVALAEIAADSEKIVFVGKTRIMRDTIFRMLFGLAYSSNDVVCIGRPINNDTIIEELYDWRIFDVKTRPRLEHMVSDSKKELDKLKQELAGMPRDMSLIIF